MLIPQQCGFHIDARVDRERAQNPQTVVEDWKFSNQDEANESWPEQQAEKQAED